MRAALLQNAELFTMVPGSSGCHGGSDTPPLPHRCFDALRHARRRASAATNAPRVAWFAQCSVLPWTVYVASGLCAEDGRSPRQRWRGHYFAVSIGRSRSCSRKRKPASRTGVDRLGSTQLLRRQRGSGTTTRLCPRSWSCSHNAAAYVREALARTRPLAASCEGVRCRRSRLRCRGLLATTAVEHRLGLSQQGPPLACEA
jgi:hypothetical protein